MGYLWAKDEEINFSSMCHIFVIPRGLRGHSLLILRVEEKWYSEATCTR